VLLLSQQSTPDVGLARRLYQKHQLHPLPAVICFSHVGSWWWGIVLVRGCLVLLAGTARFAEYFHFIG